MMFFRKKTEAPVPTKSAKDLRIEAEEKLIQASIDLTVAWEQARSHKSRLKPWIDWSHKSVYISKYGTPIPVFVPDTGE